MAPASTTATALSTELEVLLMRRLSVEWDNLNLSLFRGAMRRPVLRLGTARARLGQWTGPQRTLELSRSLILEYPWGQVIEVLKHEMAHQFVDECLAVDESPHGATFQSVCARLGIDGKAAGAPPISDPAHGERTTESSAQLRLVARIKKLLALAQSTNRHEAENAANAAQRIMLRYNLTQQNPHADEAFSFVHLGAPSGRTFEHQRRVSVILAEHFFVEAIWVPSYRPLEGKRASILEICGTRPNLAMATHVHDFLHAAAARLWRAYQQTHGIRSNRDRRTFLAGVMEGFEAKLEAQRVTLRAEGLVWVPGARLQGYFQRRHPHTRRVSSAGNRRNEAFDRGRQAGVKLVLSRPVDRSASERMPPALTASADD